MKDKFGVEILDCQNCGYQDYETGFGEPKNCPDCGAKEIVEAEEDRNSYIVEAAQ